MKYFKFLIVFAAFLVVACASTFDASSIHHTFGIGSSTHVKDSSIVVNSKVK